MGIQEGAFSIPPGIAGRKFRESMKRMNWYCRCCNHQYPNDSRFKAHLKTQTHILLSQIFSRDHILPYSEECQQKSLDFEMAFLQHLKDRYGSTRVLAKEAYYHYVLDRHSYSLHDTRWSTVSLFVYHLGQTGKCKVEGTDQGLFITYFTIPCTNKRFKPNF